MNEAQVTMVGLETIAIVLSLVALIVTVIGFFASLKFYRDGVQMQTHAEKVLSKIEERANAIQSQVGGIFDKTLDAALGRVTPQEAEKQQRKLLLNSEEEPAPCPPESVSGLASDTELTRKIFSYYGFRQMRLTDVTEATGRSVFNQGRSSGFNLFDGVFDIVFFGNFADFEPAEIVARTRLLLGNLEISYKRLDDAINVALRNEGKKVLDRISVEILVGGEIDTSALLDKINKYQLQARNVSVTLLKPEGIEASVADEYRQMKP